MKASSKLVGAVMPLSLILAWAIPTAADSSSVSNPPSTYVNANFGPKFYRSTTTLDFDSATADVFAKRTQSEVRLSASANMDLNETSSAYSAYNIGTVHAGSGSLTQISVTPQSLVLSGTAHWAMNLWFDSDKDGEYFVWQHNSPDYLTGLGNDVYALGACVGVGCTETGPTVTIDQNTPMFLIPYCTPGFNYPVTLTMINAGACTSIPKDTPTAMWVGIDVPGGTVGSGRATIGTPGCQDSHGDGDAQGSDGKKHHASFSGNSCDNSNSGAQDADSQGNNFQSTSVASSTFTADLNSETVTMVGSGLDNGVPVNFTLVVTDLGVLAPAIYNLTLSDGRTVIGTFTSGDIAFQ